MSKVYFITNRNVDQSKSMDKWIYTDDELHTGQVEIEKYFKTYRIKEESLNFYIGSEKEKLDQVFKNLKQNIILFFHGFATSFENSLCNIQRMYENIQTIDSTYDSDIIDFSFPSNGKIDANDYLLDQADARQTGLMLNYFFQYLRDNVKKDHNINIICHSMGNYLFRQGYQSFKQNNAITNLFNELLLIEADEDYDALDCDNKLKGIDKLVNRISIIYNYSDWILKYSNMAFKNNMQRLGLKGPKIMDNLPINIQLLDVTPYIDTNEHGYIVQGNNPIFWLKLVNILKGK